MNMSSQIAVVISARMAVVVVSSSAECDDATSAIVPRIR
jgi:hypothetical protein